jgi:hypothetical protein
MELSCKHSFRDHAASVLSQLPRDIKNIMPTEVGHPGCRIPHLLISMMGSLAPRGVPFSMSADACNQYWLECHARKSLGAVERQLQPAQH